jgi:hypothetical protein
MPSDSNYNISSAMVRDINNNNSNTFTLTPSLQSYFQPTISSVTNTTLGTYTEISIVGTNFVAGDVVSFNGTVISQSFVTVSSNTLIKVTMPYGINYNISSATVTHPSNSSSASYSIIPSLQSYFPIINSVYISNNNEKYIYIVGTKFKSGDTVSFVGPAGVSASSSYSVQFINAELLKVTMLSPYDIDTVMVTDIYGNPSNTFTLTTDLISNICFIAGTPVTTDQGNIPIEKIDTTIHTIRNKKIVAITKTVTQDKYLVCFEKDALGNNIPSQKTIISKNHKLFYNGKMRMAKEFLKDFSNVVKVKYTKQLLYNVLLEEHDKMMVNNLICETLHPENGVAKVYMALQNLDTEDQQLLIKKINAHVIKNNVFSSKKLIK